MLGRGMTHFNVLGAAPTGRQMAEWHNRLQELAATTRLGIPVTISTDPRHSFSDNPLAGMHGGPVLAVARGASASRRSATRRSIERFGDIARREYTAVGIRVALHPQVDLATEPRWSRQVATFGEDPDLLGRAWAPPTSAASRAPSSAPTRSRR